MTRLPIRVDFQQELFQELQQPLYLLFFFLLYSTEINVHFLAQLLKSMNGGFDINDGMVTFIVAIMGFATTVVTTLTVMQLFKNSGNMSQKK